MSENGGRVNQSLIGMLTGCLALIVSVACLIFNRIDSLQRDEQMRVRVEAMQGLTNVLHKIEKKL